MTDPTWRIGDVSAQRASTWWVRTATPLYSASGRTTGSAPRLSATAARLTAMSAAAAASSPHFRPAGRVREEFPWLSWAGS